MTVVISKLDQSVEESEPEKMEHKLPYPRAVYFIALTEFCERFSYYGMRAVLTIYMTNVLNFSGDLATTVYHVFLLMCYALPVLGGILADSFIGKYKTILYISIVYSIGNIILSLSSVAPLNLPRIPLALLGLFLMAVGTGGIKPCVVALGGEQFILPFQEKQLAQFFSVFMFAVSVGNMLSTVITPVFRKDVACFEDETCYPLAFGVPASLMLVAIVIFVSGKRRYKTVAPDGNVMVKVIKCITHAIKEKYNSSNKSEKKPHWLDYALDKFDVTLINDTKRLLSVLVYYLPIPMFFALYEQLGSRWTLQATRMNGVIGHWTIKPDQMQVANAVLMFIFIPFFEMVVYPVMRKCGIFKRPMQRMVVGGVLAALSFMIAGIVERSVENSYSLIPRRGETHLNFINTLPCPVLISEIVNKSLDNFNANYDYNQMVLENRIISGGDNYVLHSLKTFQPIHVSIELVTGSSSSPSCSATEFAFQVGNNGNGTIKWQGYVRPLRNSFQSLVISISRTVRGNASLLLTNLPSPEDILKSKEGNSKLRIIIGVNIIPPGIYNMKSNDNENIGSASTFVADLRLLNPEGEMETLKLNPSNDSTSGIISTETFEVDPDRYQLIILAPGKNASSQNALSDWFEVKTGGNYIVGIVHNDLTNSTQTQLIPITSPNSIHMLWLLPQYVLMAWGEILFMISGIEFSFTEAPASMKSVVQSCWHLTNAVGNSIVIISAQFHFSQAYEFFAFAAAMGIDIVIFALLAMKYKYVIPDKSEKVLPECEIEENNVK